MRFGKALVILALAASVQSNVFEQNGMGKISAILDAIADIQAASEDMDIMESRLEKLDEKTSSIQTVQQKLTEAMDVGGSNPLTNAFSHENIDAGGKNYFSFSNQLSIFLSYLSGVYR